MSITTIRKGIQELENLENLGQTKRIRKAGAGRKKIEIKNPSVVEDVEAIMNTAGIANKIPRGAEEMIVAEAKKRNLDRESLLTH